MTQRERHQLEKAQDVSTLSKKEMEMSVGPVQDSLVRLVYYKHKKRRGHC